MERSYALGIHITKSRTFLALFDLLEDDIICIYSAKNSFIENENVSESDPTYWWEEIKFLIASVPKKIRENILVIAITSSPLMIVPLAKNLEPAGPAINAEDCRNRHKFLNSIDPQLSKELANGLGRDLAYTALDKIHYFISNENIKKRMSFVTSPADFIASKFTGKLVLNLYDAIELGLTSPGHEGLLRKIIETLKIPESIIPHMVPPLHTLGYPQWVVAENLGIPKKTQILSGVPDIYAELFHIFHDDRNGTIIKVYDEMKRCEVFSVAALSTSLRDEILRPFFFENTYLISKVFSLNKFLTNELVKNHLYKHLLLELVSKVPSNALFIEHKRPPYGESMSKTTEKWTLKSFSNVLSPENIALASFENLALNIRLYLERSTGKSVPSPSLLTTLAMGSKIAENIANFLANALGRPITLINGYLALNGLLDLLVSDIVKILPENIAPQRGKRSFVKPLKVMPDIELTSIYDYYFKVFKETI